MKPDRASAKLLGIARSKAKMYEYDVPLEDHIEIPKDPAELFVIAIGLLGEVAAKINNDLVFSDEEQKKWQKRLIFSAYFFDAFLQAHLDEELDPYVLVMGSASYYLCGLPGSASVLAKTASENSLNLSGGGLEHLLLWLLLGNFSMELEGTPNKKLKGLAGLISQYFFTGENQEKIARELKKIRQKSYESGSPRELLLSDVVSAVVHKRIENSTWFSLPNYSDLELDTWQDTLQKPTFIRELWPSQHLLGEYGVFKGRSAVVQMPTSAGKTKAVELIIRSAFLAERTSLAVIVAPFRALCHEIRNGLLAAFQGEAVNVDELSDTIQTDFDIAAILGQKQIIVVTPEKLNYVLRYTPELSQEIGVLIFDEGHQFDSGTRGVTYELLLSSLKTMLQEGTQTVLISAVISNAEAVNEWLNGDEGVIVPGAGMQTTYRTIGFTSWQYKLGQVQFIDDEYPFFVPKVIEQYPLDRKPREKQRVFPAKDDGKAVALFLGLKLCHNGSVAIFCGRKDSASGFCEDVVDLYKRNLAISPPAEYSDADEIERLHYLHVRHFGEEAYVTKCTKLGVLSHHGNTPHGIRLATEHALQCNLAKFVICTSTLAQGVNLPLKYLIVSSVFQGKTEIKVRDFHNLIGRAGRAGMHTEGSILFADPKLFDQKNNWKERWRWDLATKLLDREQSEACTSNLLTLVEEFQLKSDDGKHTLSGNFLDILVLSLENPTKFSKLPKQLAEKHAGYSEKEIAAQINSKMRIVSAIESYLMANWQESEEDLHEDVLHKLVSNTLAYYLAEPDQKEALLKLFTMLAENIHKKAPDQERKRIYAKTLQGVFDSVAIEKWVSENIEELSECETHEELLACLWHLIKAHTTNKALQNCTSQKALKKIAKGWIAGDSYGDLFNYFEPDTKIGKFTPKLDHVVDICEDGLGYDGMLIIAGVIEIANLLSPEAEWIDELRILQKRLKYGLSNEIEIRLYELGFADRVIAQEMSKVMDFSGVKRSLFKSAIRSQRAPFIALLNKYPEYYSKRLESLVGVR